MQAVRKGALSRRLNAMELVEKTVERCRYYKKPLRLGPAENKTDSKISIFQSLNFFSVLMEIFKEVAYFAYFLLGFPK